MKRQLLIPGLDRVPNALAFRPVMTVTDLVTTFRFGGG
jgi:hypothetical protein